MPPTRIKLPKDAGAPRPRASCSFGRFRFDPSQQLLLDGDIPVRLGSRALEILATLLDHAGKVVSRDEILARVWPNSSVEATNLKVHIAALRRALGKHHIETVNGAGYRFVAPLEREQRTRTDLMPVVGRFSARLGVWMLMFGGASAYLMTTIPWPDPQEMAMVTAGLFLIAAAGAVITLNVFTARVILRAEGLELRRLLGRNALQRSDILRVRRLTLKSGTQMFEIVPRSAGAKLLRIPPVLRADAAFRHWFESLPVLTEARVERTAAASA